MFKMVFKMTVLLFTFIALTTTANAGDFKYVGVKKCKTCHKTEKIGNQFGIWSEAAHANALKSLSSEKSLEYAKKNGIADPTKDPKCLNCHATMATVDAALIEPAPKGKLTMEEGVSCESCHGAGNKYKSAKVMSKKKYAADKAGQHKLALAAGLVMPEEKVCLTCHNDKNPFHKPFDYKKMVAKVSHPVPAKTK